MGVNHGVCIFLFNLLSLFYYEDEPRYGKTVQDNLHANAQNAVPFPLKTEQSPSQSWHSWSTVTKCVTRWTAVTRKSSFLFNCAHQLKLNNGFKHAQRVTTVTTEC